MRTPLSWLKEHVVIDLSPEEIASLLIAQGIEVEAIEKITFPFHGVVCAKVKSIRPHPKAESLRLATLFDGEEEIEVVTGARDIEVGKCYAFARKGSNLPGGKRIETRTIEGVASSGMLCSEAELQLGDFADGLLELPETLKEGTLLDEFLADTVFHLSLTPNLGHCLSIRGIAREIAAGAQTPLKKIPLTLHEAPGKKIQDEISISVEDPLLAPRYSCRFLYDLKVGPSPFWVRWRLKLCGVRAHSNVVDATNLLLLEYGLPLHAFDAAAISGKRLCVRSEAPFKEIETLDGKKHSLARPLLLICDAEKPLALAGVMGGLSSSVTDTTKAIVLEAAYFKPSAARLTSRTLKITTEGSQRFERGVDPALVDEVRERVTSLIATLCHGKIAQGYLSEGKGVPDRSPIPLRFERVNMLIGVTISPSEVIAILKRLEMVVVEKEGALLVTPPSYRNDITIEEDLIEEVARLYGYSNLTLKSPKAHFSALFDAPLYLYEKKVRTRLIAEGLQEWITPSLISPELARLGSEDFSRSVHVLHATSEVYSVLRTSLLPGMLSSAKMNANRGTHDLAVFELGRVHMKDGEKFQEFPMLGILLSGLHAPSHFDPKRRPFDLLDLKGIVENFMKALGLPPMDVEASHLPTLHPGRQMRLKIKERVLGVIGEIHPSLVRKFDLPTRAFFGELQIAELIASTPALTQVKGVSSYPGTSRDWTVTIDESTPLHSILSSFRSPLLTHVELIDIFRGEKIGKDKKNLTLRFFYKSPDRTLQAEEVDKTHTSLLSKFQSEMK